MSQLRATTVGNLREVLRDLEDHVNNRVRRMATDLANELAMATPKDTTHAASNWIWGSDVQTMPAGSREHVDWSAFRAGLSYVFRWTVNSGMLVMSNVVHYIDDLDRGWSPKAPPNFVRMTIRTVLSRFRR